MHNTKGNVALRNISREKCIFMILCSIQNRSSSPFLSLITFLNWQFSSCSYKMVLVKKECYLKTQGSSQINCLPVKEGTSTCRPLVHVINTWLTIFSLVNSRWWCDVSRHQSYMEIGIALHCNVAA